jgi:transcriptional regulator with PAS, ATPase and Fis domain
VGAVFQAFVGQSADAVKKPWEQALSGTLQELPAGTFLVARGGERRPISGTVAPIRDHKGSVTGTVLVFGRGNEHVAPRPVVTGESPTDGGIKLGSFKMIAVSAAMKQVLTFARRVAQSEVSTVLLEGESGTGKDVLAQFLHYYGRRHEGPFVALNCAAIPETLLESELFGYEKGAFTDARTAKAGLLEMASSGSIFLDEIGEMPLTLQAKLLRVLEDQCIRRLGGVRDIQIDVRVVAATNRKLTEAIEEGRFRLDLYYRLNVIEVVLPALRERKEDILPLAEHFIHVYNDKFKRNIQGLSQPAAAALMSHTWPGNVRELRNVVERAMVLEESDRIQGSSLYIASTGAGLNRGGGRAETHEAPFQASLAEAEKNLVMKALQKASGNQTRAAVLLGITRDTLRYKMKKFNLR